MGLGKKVFTRKNGNQKGGKLYKWTPIKTNKTTKKGDNRDYFCTAKPRSNGEDWTTTYVYRIVVIDGAQQRVAYVECDYVK